MQSNFARIGAAVLFLAAQCALADSPLYRWVDEQGRVHYGNSTPGKHSTRTLQAPPAPSSEDVRAGQARAADARRQLTHWETSRPRLVLTPSNTLVTCERALRIVEFLREHTELPVLRPLDDGQVAELWGEERAGYLSAAKRGVEDTCVSAQEVDMYDLWVGLFWPRTARAAILIPTQFITPPAVREPDANFKDARPAGAPANPTTSLVNARRPSAPANPSTSITGARRPLSGTSPGAGSFR